MSARRNQRCPNDVHPCVRNLAACVLVLLIGCTNGAPEQLARQAESLVDPEKPCELLAPQQVEAAINTDVEGEREVDSHDPATRICSYATTEPWASVAVSLEANVSPDEFAKEVRRDRPNTEPVDNIGDSAFIHGCSSITMYASDVAVTASVQHLTTCEETSVVLQSLGRAIVESLRAASTS